MSQSFRVSDIECAIRPAVAGDLEAINRIYNAEIVSGLATWDLEPWTIGERRKWFAAMTD